jgi:hypothetical protein
MNVLTDAQALEFLTVLRKLTTDNILKWAEQDPGRVARFYAHTEQFLYSLQSVDDDELAPYSLKIYPASGGLLLDEIVSSVEPKTPDQIAIVEVLGSLYHIVLSKVRGTENLGERLLDDLRHLEEPF